MSELPLKAGAGAFVPDWLVARDHPWLDALLTVARGSDGSRLREWRLRAAEPLGVAVHPARVELAVPVLEALFATHAPDVGTPRMAVFRDAQRQRSAGAFDRDSALGAAVEAELYADLASERILRVGELPTAEELALRVNLAFAQRVVRGAARIDLALYGSARPVLRQILLCRLLAVACPTTYGVFVEISGPMALFRHTTRYGRALGSVVPVLRAAESFSLTAWRPRGGALIPVRLEASDPLFPPGTFAPVFDSRLEERFARDFTDAAPEWELLREPEPVPVDGTWVFPDFAMVHREDRRRRWLVEIVGYWSEAYLDAKLGRLARANRTDLIVCVDQALGTEERPWAKAGRVVSFHKRLDPLAVIEATLR